MVSSFFLNMAVLITFLFISLELHSYINQKIKKKRLVILVDSIIGGILSFLVIFHTFKFDGMVIDIRSVPIFLISYTYGLKAGLISSILPLVYRWYLGGGTIWQGIVLGIVSPVAVGVFFHRNTKKILVENSFNIKRVVLAYSAHCGIRAILSAIILPITFKVWLKINISMTLFSLIAVFFIVLLINKYSETVFLIREMKKNQKEISIERQKLEDKNKKLNMLSEQHMATLGKLYRRNDELKMANKAKSNLVANVSHELKTPLNITMTYLEYVLEDKDEPLSENQREMLEIAYKNSERLQKLIDELLDISTIESKKMKLNLERINVKDFINSLVKERALSIKEKNIDIKLNIIEEDFSIVTDELRLRQVIGNVLDNAIKFSDEEDIEIKLKTKQNYVEIYIKDSGIGIDPNKIDKVFNPFYQADDSSAKKYKGVGLGLYIAKKIVKTMGGEISVENNIHRGCCFKVIIPTEHTL